MFLEILGAKADTYKAKVCTAAKKNNISDLQPKQREGHCFLRVREGGLEQKH